jgi:hypothetical protein
MFRPSSLFNFVSGAEKNEKPTKKEGRNESYEFFRLFSFFSANLTKWNYRALGLMGSWWLETQRYAAPLGFDVTSLQNL